MFQIDHLGIAVKSLAAAKSVYEKLGFKVAVEETVDGEKVRVAMLPVGDSRLELMEPMSDDSAVARFASAAGQLALVTTRLPAVAIVVVLAVVLAVVVALVAPGVAR